MSKPHHSLSPDPNLFYSNDDQNEFVRDLKSELLARRSCLDFDSVKISQSQIRTKKKKKKRTNSASSSQKQSDAKAICLFKANIESQFHKNNLASKRQLICAKTDSCLRPIYLLNADSKSRYLKLKDKEDKEGK